MCDEGGECHLQDMTVMTGHNYRDNEFDKRTFRNQNLGPLVNHEMNRCIQCYRCVRYYREYGWSMTLRRVILWMRIHDIPSALFRRAAARARAVARRTAYRLLR